MRSQDDSGLSDEQVRELRANVADGRRPRVRVSGPQFPAGTTGVVVAVGDPQTDGAEFVTVRVKAGGVTDELGFSPRELSSGKASRAAKHASGAAPAARRAKQAAPAKQQPPAKLARAAKPATVTKGSASVDRAAPLPARPAGRTAQRRAQETAAGLTAPSAQPQATGSRSTRRRIPPLPTVSLEFTSSGAAWSVSVRRGSRIVTKSAPVQPGVISAVAELLGLAAVSEAVAAVNDAAFREAQARAEALRAELAAVEAELDGHRHP